VATGVTLPAQTPVVVRFRLPGEDEMLCFDAHVAWSAAAGEQVASPGMGLEFDDADARTLHASRLERWAARRDAQASGDGPAAG
jgi:Tfp pilus assembly protein PilZ